MSVFSRFRKLGASREEAPETNSEIIRRLVPQDKRNEITEAALEGPEITMIAGELREAAIDAGSALVVKTLYPDGSFEHDLAKKVIDDRAVVLGRSRHALELAEGDPEKAAGINLDKIGEAIDQVHSPNGNNPN